MDKYKRKRLKVSSKITKEFGLYHWDTYKLRKIILNEYNMEYTSKRINIYYFRPLDEYKLSIFCLKYGEYIKS